VNRGAVALKTRYFDKSDADKGKWKEIVAITIGKWSTGVVDGRWED
jgi:hypothetical protein